MSKGLDQPPLRAEDHALELADLSPEELARRENLLQLRRAARAEKKRQDEIHRQRHRLILQLMDGPQGEWIREKAHEQIDKWERNQLCNPRYVCEWRQWLAMPRSFFEAAVLREDDLGVSMRQNSPFDHSFNLVEQELSQWIQDNEKH